MKAILACLLAFLPLTAQAAPVKARISILDSSILLLFKADGSFWERPLPPNEYRIEVSGVSVAGLVSDEEFPTFLKAVLPEPLKGNALYGVTVRETGTGEIVAAGDLSTQVRARIQPSAARDEAHFRFEVSSDTPLILVPDDRLNLVEILRKSRIDEKGHRTKERTKDHKVRLFGSVQTLSGGGDGSWSSGVLVDLPPDDRLSSGSAGLRLEGLRDIFGQEVTAEGTLVPARVPKGKDDASAYGRIFFESAQGRGSLDALSLDLKAQPLFQMAGSWLFRPELTASVSKNGPRSSNSIRVAGLFSRTAVRRESAFVYQTVFLGPSIEADRNFDRVNAIADLRWQPGIRNLYRPREIERIIRAAQSGNRTDELALTRIGYGLEFRLGAEAGSSASHQTVTNSLGNQSLEIDRYTVLRARPHVNAFYEVGLPLDWQLTLNVSSSLRYLFTEELTAVENADRSLSLRKIEGFAPYTEASLSLSFDPGQHVALALTYKDGSEPPVFVEVEKYSVGVVLKY